MKSVTINNNLIEKLTNKTGEEDSKSLAFVRSELQRAWWDYQSAWTYLGKYIRSAKEESELALKRMDRGVMPHQDLLDTMNKRIAKEHGKVTNAVDRILAALYQMHLYGELDWEGVEYKFTAESNH